MNILGYVIWWLCARLVAAWLGLATECAFVHPKSTARRSNQSILKEISPESSLEELMLKLKLQYFGHLMWRTDLLEKTLMLGKTEGGRRRGRQRMRWLDGIIDLMDMSLNKLRDVEGQGSLGCCSPRGHKESDPTERLKNNKHFWHNWRSWLKFLATQKAILTIPQWLCSCVHFTD